MTSQTDEEIKTEIIKLRDSLDRFLESGDCKTFRGDVYVETIKKIEDLNEILTERTKDV